MKGGEGLRRQDSHGTLGRWDPSKLQELVRTGSSPHSVLWRFAFLESHLFGSFIHSFIPSKENVSQASSVPGTLLGLGVGVETGRR